jgi:hypothetical protein
MLYNAQRKRVRDWIPGDISTCPECQSSLIAKRGEIVIWHWAHRPTGDTVADREPCGHSESQWHLAWKATYDDFPQWTVEQPVEGFRVDAANLATGRLREFIHCLSPYYAGKHKILSRLDYEIQWIFDGNEFVSQKTWPMRKDGMKDLLKPKAFDVFKQLGGRCWVHWDGRLWKHWKENIWYPRKGAERLLMAVERHLRCEEPDPLDADADFDTEIFLPADSNIDTDPVAFGVLPMPVQQSNGDSSIFRYPEDPVAWIPGVGWNVPAGTIPWRVWEEHAWKKLMREVAEKLITPRRPPEEEQRTNWLNRGKSRAT